MKKSTFMDYKYIKGFQYVFIFLQGHFPNFVYITESI